MFAYFLETTSSVSTVCTGRVPGATLDLATVAASLWQSITNEVINSVDKVSDKRWVKIFEAAKRYIGAHRPVSSMDVACAQQGLLSGRATCYEPDSD